MDAVSAREVTIGINADAMRPSMKPSTDAERIVWSHAYWARLNHENAQFIPTQARQCANEALSHAREMGLVEIMAGELKVAK